MEHTALIYTMVLMSAADSDMTDSELFTIGELVRTLPAFEGFNPDQLPKTTEDCANILGQEGGMETVISLVKDSLPDRLRETAYALACDIAAVDGSVGQEEARLLELLRHGLDIERLVAAAIERGARAHYQTVD
jgi:tellurite resistance protein